MNRARQYRRQLDRSLATNDWEAVGLTAIHLAIASSDAVTAVKLGQVWSGTDHSGSVELLAQVKLDGVDAVRRQLRSLLEAKTKVEYGAEELSPSRASELAKLAVRVFEWSQSALGR